MGLKVFPKFVTNCRFSRVIQTVITRSSYGSEHIGLTIYCKTISAVCTVSAVLYDNFFYCSFILHCECLNMGIKLPFLWSDFLACQEIWILNPNWSKSKHTKSGLGTLHCTVQFICTQKLDLHAIQLRGSTTSFEYHKSLLALVFIGCCCPGPGSCWGNLAVLPASKYQIKFG